MNLIFKLFDITENVKNKHISRFLSLIVRSIANICFPLYFRIVKGSGKKHNLDKELIVSFTSFPKRINKVWIVIESILHNTILPDKILLYLSKEQFPTLKELPKSLLSLQSKGLVIKLVENDIRSYKKFYYAFIDYPKSYVITIDDDIIYPENTIESLLKSFNTHKDCVIARYGSNAFPNGKEIAPQSEWSKNISSSFNPSKYNFFGSGGGTLFDVEKINKGVLDSKSFISICKLADDVWLNAFVRISGLNIYFCNDKSAEILNIQIRNDSRLFTINTEQNYNEEQIKSVRTYCKKKYNIDPFILN